jgi:adenosylcobinamide-GDP ribazoletransferase
VKGLVTAVRYLTILPLPSRSPAPAGALGRSAAWFPVVGAALGVALAAADGGLEWLFPSMVSAVLVIAAWKILTGGLHLDGFADCLDGLQGGDPAGRLRIMRDSRIGVFGAAGLILLLLLDVTALAQLGDGARWRTLVAAPAIGRAAPPVLAVLLPRATDSGQGASFARHVGAPGAGLAVLAAAAVAASALGWAGAVALVAGLGAALVVGGLWSRRLGGLTGDVFGAAVEIAEMTVLLTLVAGIHLRSS